MPPPPPPLGAPGAILVDRDLAPLVGTVLLSDPPVAPDQIQPASVDLRLGAVAHPIRAGFQPERVPIEERLAELSEGSISLEGEGRVLERGHVYLVPLEEELRLPPDVHARFNPRSSLGRCDVFTRVVVPGHPRFDEAPAGYRGRIWLEIAPLSFPVRLRRGDRPCQVRLARGAPALSHTELLVRYAETPLCHDEEGPLPAERVRFDAEGGLELRVGLRGRDPCAWRSRRTTTPVSFGEERAHDPAEFWEPVPGDRASAGGGPGSARCLLEPGLFHLLASRERIAVPPDLAAEMLPVDLGLGELRNNYAGFFDCGFGWHDRTPRGTPAVLEVRAHDVPFLVEDGQILFRLRFFRTTGAPDRLYGEGREGESYRDQDLTLGRAFR